MIQVLLHIFQSLQVLERRIASMRNQRVVEVNGEKHKNDKHRYYDYGRRNCGGKRVIPKLHPAQDGDLDQKQKETYNIASVTL